MQFEDNEFDTATATTVEEAKQLMKVGFQKGDEFNDVHIYRRPTKLAC